MDGELSEVDAKAWRLLLARLDCGHELRLVPGADVWHEGAWLRVAERGEDGELLVSPEPPSPFAAFAQAK